MAALRGVRSLDRGLGAGGFGEGAEGVAGDAAKACVDVWATCSGIEVVGAGAGAEGWFGGGRVSCTLGSESTGCVMEVSGTAALAAVMAAARGASRTGRRRRCARA